MRLLTDNLINDFTGIALLLFPIVVIGCNSGKPLPGPTPEMILHLPTVYLSSTPTSTATQTPFQVPSATPSSTSTMLLVLESTVTPSTTEPMGLSESTPAPPHSAPTIYDIRFCDRPCDEDGAQTTTSFPARTTHVYLAWNYQGFYPGMPYTRIWSNNGDEWVHYECTWQGPEAGQFTLKLWDVDGLRSGAWVLDLYIEGLPAAQAVVEVRGSNSYWDPAGHLPCPDF
jgi:hypothetical protein